LISARFDKHDDRLLQRVFQEYPLYTNDKTWAIQLLPFGIMSESTENFVPFNSDDLVYFDFGTTENYIYLYTRIPVIKRDIKDYFPFQFL
jgi:hypothetical protein